MEHDNLQYYTFICTSFDLTLGKRDTHGENVEFFKVLHFTYKQVKLSLSDI